jgi:hypothetical protein
VRQLKYMLMQTALLACSISALGEDFELNAWQFEGIVYSKFTWTVHLKGTELKIERPGKKNKVKRIKPGDIEILRRTLDQSGFASLRSEYNHRVTDGAGCWIKVSSESWKNSVYVFGSTNPNDKDAGDIRRFLEVWRVLKRMAGLSGVSDMCPNDGGPLRRP